MTAREQLLDAIANAPDPLVEEVLDFLLFVQARQNAASSPERSASPPPKRQWSPHFFERTSGAWKGDPLTRLP